MNEQFYKGSDATTEIRSVYICSENVPVTIVALLGRSRKLNIVCIFSLRKIFHRERNHSWFKCSMVVDFFLVQSVQFSSNPLG